MQGIDKIITSNYWITIILIALFGCIVFLKLLNAQKLTERFYKLFNFSFLEQDSEGSKVLINLFEVVMFLFSSLSIALLLFYFQQYIQVNNKITVASFLSIYSFVFCYFIAKKVLEFALVRLFLLKKQLRTFLNTKAHYLHSISFILFILLIFYEYTEIHPLVVFYFSVLLFSVRFLFFLLRNKKLIFNKLFYFILYICAFEIAPLFILLKLMF
ncbi:DUF4271 domain-containing protein [Polaribacter sp.]|uniref:DUF4271 domain-containing protein n=1 Tax=Polaribacter sp. TaxID=1920175 RepID=UPI0025DBA84F|nr:DUF4271 domain-containing protein [Polaribacter sp.]